jgi:hypothetical protein
VASPLWREGRTAGLRRSAFPHEPSAEFSRHTVGSQPGQGDRHVEEVPFCGDRRMQGVGAASSAAPGRQRNRSAFGCHRHWAAHLVRLRQGSERTVHLPAGLATCARRIQCLALPAPRSADQEQGSRAPSQAANPQVQAGLRPAAEVSASGLCGLGFDRRRTDFDPLHLPATCLRAWKMARILFGMLRISPSVPARRGRRACPTRNGCRS